MKTSIIALLITAAFASPSLAAGDTTLTTSSKCPEGQYDNGTGGHTYCSRINNNTRDIALSNTAMYGNSERVWEKGVFQGWGKDGKVIVNADGTLAEGASWEDAGLAGRIWYHDGELQTINGKIEIVEKAGQYVITNKAEVAGKIDTAIDNSVTNLINQEGSQLNVAVNGAKETANDFDRRITNNSKDIQTNKAKNEAVWELMFGGQPHFTDSGKFDGFLRAESDKLVVGPNGEFYGYKENAGLYGKITLKTDDHEKRITKNTARIDGNDKRIESNIAAIEDTTARNDAAWGLVFGGTPYFNENGEFKGFLRTDKDSINVGPNGEIYGYRENAGLYGKFLIDNENVHNELTRLEDVKADKADLDALEGKGTDAYLELNGKVDNVITGGMMAMNGVIKLGDYVKANGNDIKADIAGKVNTVIDNSVTNLVNNEGSKLNLAVNGAKETANDFEQRISKNTTDIAAQDKIISKQGERLTNVEYTADNNRLAITKLRDETVRLDEVKADRTDLADLESKGNDAYTNLNGKVTAVEGDITTIKNVASFAINGKDVAINKAGDVYEGVRNSITNEINSAVDLAVTAIKGDVHNTWENNKGDLAVAVNGKYEGAKTEITNNVLNEIGDIALGDSETIVNIKNDISKDVTNQLKLDAKGAALNIKKDIVEGNNEYANNIHAEYVKAKDAADVVIKDFQAQIDATNAELTAQVSRGEEAAKEANQKALGAFNFMDDKKLDKTDFDDAVNQGKDAYANVNGRIDGAINKGNEELTNINNQFTELNETVNNINAGIEDNSAKLIAMGKAESTRLETDLRNDGQAAYDDLASRIERATSEEEINNILNQYKKDQLAKIQARVNAARPGAEQALADAKDNAKKEANLYVKGKIDQAIADNTQAGKDYVKDEIDNAIAGMVPGEANLDGRLEAIENTINKGKVVLNTAKNQGVNAGKTIVAKAPAVKGAVAGKVSSATTYAKTVNAKADAALVLGYDNSQAIVQERSDRIQGQRDTLNAANSYTDSRFNSLQSQVDSNRRKAAAGVSGVSAMANIPQLNGDAKFSIGAGIGGFDGEQSLAIGGNARINDNVILRSSISSSTQGEMVWGAGVGFQW